MQLDGRLSHCVSATKVGRHENETVFTPLTYANIVGMRSSLVERDPQILVNHFLGPSRLRG